MSKLNCRLLSLLIRISCLTHWLSLVILTCLHFFFLMNFILFFAVGQLFNLLSHCPLLAILLDLNMLRSPDFVDFSCYLFITMYLHRTIYRKALSRFKCFLKSFLKITKAELFQINVTDFYPTIVNSLFLGQFADQLPGVVKLLFLLALSVCLCRLVVSYRSLIFLLSTHWFLSFLIF